MNKGLRNFLCFGLLSIVCVSAADAQIYKWKDKDGKVVFGDTLPSGKTTQVEKIAAPANTPSGASGTPPESTDWQAKERQFEQRRILREKEQAEADQADEKKQKACEALRDQQRRLASTQGRRAVSWNSSKGDYDYLSDNDREKMNGEARQMMKKLGCN
jgi:hypothetical protein